MDTNNRNEQLDERLKDVDQADLEAFIQKRLDEEQNKNETASATLRLESLGILGNLLIIFVLGLFIVSPLIQLIVRVVTDNSDKILLVSSLTVKRYQWTIRNINRLARFTAVLTYLWIILYAVSKRIESRRHGVAVKKSELTVGERISKCVPFIVFVMFVVSIIAVTRIRGANEYDLTGHPYMYESIFSYITYPLVYFFCGMMLFDERLRKFLLYVLLFSGLPLNILALVDKWVTPVKYYTSTGVSPCAVFHNSNHYGYYLAITVITGALMFVYEKKLWLRIVSTVSAVIANIVMIMNNTLGAYLATLFIFILFIIYCFAFVKENKKESLIILCVFILITVVMRFFYSSLMSSFLTLFGDINMIIEDPLEADSAGSSRWRLWKGTVEHMGESPFLGFGVEGLLNTYGVGTPHNEFLQYAEFFGIQTSLLYIIACSMILLRVFFSHKTLDKTSMICFFVSLGYLASSFFGVAIYYTTPFIYIFLGLTYAEYFKKGKPKAAKTE